MLVLAIAFAHATGLSEVLEATFTSDRSDADCAPGDCPPLCPTCHFVRCPPTATATVTFRAPPARLMQTAFVDATGAPSAPDPREILHVPIALGV